MTEPATGRPDARRAGVRRHRRERQIIVFGVLVIAIGFVGVFAAGIYRGNLDGPFSQPFVTPAGQFESDVKLVCPPPDSTALPAEAVAVRVLNGTTVSGLAGRVTEDLEGRGFLSLATGNWGRDYSDTVRVAFGPDGVQHGYTVARQFAEAELVLDNREGSLVDVVLGEGFAASPSLRSVLSPELAPDLPLAANAECLPVNLVTPEPAPRNLPENPLDPVVTASATPSPSASASG
ncbi:LytR C-terminal domain-containing protein [Demequina sp.]|uniref:LytR C-terminal domain-containing protein n=1 Tax=Demequina sp. TaxID=2050685 RepID=UPI0025DB8259|nr:LytR C-terminal domain-containing protein [Demequina sp.]